MSKTGKTCIEPIYKHYVIDMSGNNNFVQIPSVQGDGNQVRGLEVELIANGLPYPIDREKVLVTIAGAKPDTKHILNPCTVTEEGYILVDITYQMSAAAGRGDYQIVLMDTETNSMLKSFPFHIVTTKSPMDAPEVDSSDEYQFLVETVSKALADYEYVMDSAQNSADAAKASETNAESSAKLSESWAVGSTDTRTGEDTNNSRYYSERSASFAAAAADSAKKASKAETFATEEATNASDFARESEDYSKTSKSYAVGGTGTRTGENTDNSKFYSEKSKEYSESWKGSLLPKGTIPFAGLKTSGNIAGHMYNISEAFVTDSRFKDGEGYSYPAGTNVYLTADGTWDCLSGTLTMELTQAEYDALSPAEKMNGTTYYISDSDNSIKDASAGSAGLLSPADKQKLDGIAAGADVNVQADWNVTDSGSDAYIKNKPSVYTKSEVDNKFSALETAIDWKEAVASFADIASAYPNPEDGWTVNVKDTDYTYRYNGTEWVVISANAIPKATQSVDGLLSREDKSAYDDANSKKHTHSNNRLLDSITVVNNTADKDKIVAGVAVDGGEASTSSSLPRPVWITSSADGALTEKRTYSSDFTYVPSTHTLNVRNVNGTASSATNADTVDGKHASDLQDYNNLTNKPTIPSVGNGTVTITQNGTAKGSFSMNQSGDTTIALTDTFSQTAVTGVKGNAENSYRTGNVTITPVDVGALALNGGTMKNNASIELGYTMANTYDRNLIISGRNIYFSADDNGWLYESHLNEEGLSFENSDGPDGVNIKWSGIDVWGYDNTHTLISSQKNNMLGFDTNGNSVSKIVTPLTEHIYDGTEKNYSYYVKTDTDFHNNEYKINTYLDGNSAYIKFFSGEITVSGEYGVTIDGGGKCCVYLEDYYSGEVFRPCGNGVLSLGNSNSKWRDVYAANGAIQTSDRTKKTDIESLTDDKTKAFIMGLNPVSYKMVDGTSGRTHYGLIAQDIENLMNDLGMDSKDFAGFIKSPKVITKDTDEDGNPLKKPIEEVMEGEYDYALRYDEFIAPLIKMVQKQQKEIDRLNEKLSKTE